MVAIWIKPLINIISFIFSESQIVNYAWRIPFFLGGILGFFVCAFRGNMEDTPVFEKLVRFEQILRYPLKSLFKKNIKNCVLGILVYLAPVFGTVFIIIFPSILPTLLKQEPYIYQKVSTLAMILLILSIAFFAYIIDKFKINIYLFFTISCLITICSIFPLIVLLQTQSYIGIIIAYLLFPIFAGMLAAVELHILSRLFPPTVKYSGLGLVINISAILAAGLVPLITTLLLKDTNGLYYVAFALIIVMAFPTIAGLILFFRPPCEKKLEKIDKDIRYLYNLDQQCDNDTLTPVEEIMFMQKLDDFVCKLVTSDDFYAKSKNNLTSNDLFISKEMDKIKITEIQSLNLKQQQQLYKKCKYLLTMKANDPSSVLHKYKGLLDNSSGNKYYTYFYSRLLIKELKAVKEKKNFTANDINLVLAGSE